MVLVRRINFLIFRGKWLIDGGFWFEARGQMLQALLKASLKRCSSIKDLILTVKIILLTDVCSLIKYM